MVFVEKSIRARSRTPLGSLLATAKSTSKKKKNAGKPAARGVRRLPLVRRRLGVGQARPAALGGAAARLRRRVGRVELRAPLRRAVGRRPKLALQFVESLPRAGMHGKHGHYTHPAQTPHPTVPYLLLHLSSLQPLLRLLEAHITQLELLLPLARSSLCVGKGGRRIDGRENSWEKRARVGSLEMVW